MQTTIFEINRKFIFMKTESPHPQPTSLARTTINNARITRRGGHRAGSERRRQQQQQALACLRHSASRGTARSVGRLVRRRRRRRDPKIKIPADTRAQQFRKFHEAMCPKWPEKRENGEREEGADLGGRGRGRRIGHGEDHHHQHHSRAERKDEDRHRSVTCRLDVTRIFRLRGGVAGSKIL